MRSRFLLPAISLLAACSVAAQAQTLQGIPALQGETVKTDGYLKAAPVGGDSLEQTIDLWMTPPHSANPIESYQEEMTKQIHLVIVSDDFKTFLHVHPTLSPTGHFLITQRFPAAGLYQVYADSLPDKMGHQVFRFELPVGRSGPAETRVMPAANIHTQAGPYEVRLSTVHLHAGKMEMLDVAITKDGKPATDLHPYLGAPAHAVFLNDKDLSYVHVHPMAMDADMSKPMVEMAANAVSPSEMMLMVSIMEAGAYKLWLQFRGANDQLYVAEFTVMAGA